MSFRCSFCGHFSYFAELASCGFAPQGIHQLVTDTGQAHACAHCGDQSIEARPGSCTRSPYGTHEWT